MYIRVKSLTWSPKSNQGYDLVDNCVMINENNVNLIGWAQNYNAAVFVTSEGTFLDCSNNYGHTFSQAISTLKEQAAEQALLDIEANLD